MFYRGIKPSVRYPGVLRCLLMLIGLILSLSVSARQIVTYTIHYADPVHIQSVVESYLSPGSSVSAYQNQLIVNGTGEELRKTRTLIEQLDVAGKQLLIAVKTSGAGSQGERSVRVTGSVEAGKRVETTTRTTVTVRDYQSRHQGKGRQGIRATEGRPAYIGTGSQAPINTWRTTPDGRVVRDQGVVSAETGFYATAWVTGNQVRITLEQSQQELQGTTVRGQQLYSQVSGRVGEWLPVGHIQQSQVISSRGISGASSEQQSTTEMIYLKVELVQ